MERTPLVRPIRDRATWLTYLQISLFAFFLYGFGATQALLRDEQGVSRTVGGLFATIFAIANVSSALFVPRAIHRWGRGRVIRVAVIGMVIGIAVYTTPGPIIIPFAGIALISMSGVALIITSNAFLLDYQKKAGPAALTEANALAALFGFFAPLIIGAGAATFFGWRAGLWALALALIVTEVLRSRTNDVYGEPQMVAQREAHHGPLPRVYWLTLGALGLLLATEFTVTLWAADLLRVRAGLEPAIAAASVSAIVGGMVIGRTVGGKLAESRPVDTLLKGSIVIAVIAFFIAWITTNPLVIIGGLVLLGVGISVHWPLGVSRAVLASGGLTDTASSMSSVAAGVSSGIAPFILGALSDNIGVHGAFLLVPVMLVIAFILLSMGKVTLTSTTSEEPAPAA